MPSNLRSTKTQCFYSNLLREFWAVVTELCLSKTGSSSKKGRKIWQSIVLFFSLFLLHRGIIIFNDTAKPEN